MPDASKAMGRPITGSGGWLTGALIPLKKTVDVTVVNVSETVNSTFRRQADGVNYIVLSVDNSRNLLEKEILDCAPDIVHIFGTEYMNNLNVADICREKGIKYVISIQGIISVYAQHYLDGVDKKYCKVNPIVKLMKTIFAADSMAMGKMNFENHGTEETKTFSKCENVIGRTQWDKDCITAINPRTNYYHVNENLRNVFYTDEKWNWENCTKHTIFLGSAAYPIKGVHQILPSIANLKKKYPDLNSYQI